MLQPKIIKGLMGNHFFEVAAMIGTGKRWALPPEWETPLVGTRAPEHLLVKADDCPSIWNAAPYLNGPIRFCERTETDELFPEGHYLEERFWAGHEAEVKRILGYNAQTRAAARRFIGPGPRACAIHFRRGEKRALQSKYGPCFPVAYIREAIKNIPAGVKYYVFSDEPEWAQTMLRSIGIEARDGEQGVQHPIEAMARISSCRYHIGANSTFSWWAGYLNRDKKKVIYMPGWRRIDFSNNAAITEAWPPPSERASWHLLNPRRTMAIIIAAYRAEKFIEDCLQGWACQEPVDGWDLDIRIGVDGCPETAAVLDRLGVPYHYSPENVGAYIIRNTLMQKPADAYSIFDADDVPMPQMFQRTVKGLHETGVCTCTRLEVGEHLNDIGSKTYARAYGRATMLHEVWAAAGGFRPDRCDSDGDLIGRILGMGYKVHFLPPPPLMLRRQHPAQLTRAPETAIGSECRREIQERHKQLRMDGQLCVEHPVTTEMHFFPGAWEGLPQAMPVSEGLAVYLNRKQLQRESVRQIEEPLEPALQAERLPSKRPDIRIPGLRQCQRYIFAPRRTKREETK